MKKVLVLSLFLLAVALTFSCTNIFGPKVYKIKYEVTGTGSPEWIMCDMPDDSGQQFNHPTLPWSIEFNLSGSGSRVALSVYIPYGNNAVCNLRIYKDGTLWDSADNVSYNSGDNSLEVFLP